MKLIPTLFLAALTIQIHAQTPSLSTAFLQSAPSDSVDYQAGMAALDAHRWEQAIQSFSAAAKTGSHVDAALYWKAYAQNRAGHAEAALISISDLRQKYPSSHWLNDARALELELRARAGDPVKPSSEPDEDLKLMALNSLMQSDPNEAMPVLQKVLSGGSSDKVKEQALLVLAQSGSPQGEKVLEQIATGNSDPALQVRAIRMMGMLGNDDARKNLANIYQTTSSTDVKRAILQSAMQSNSRDLLLNVAKSDSNADLRQDAIRQLALTGGADQLWQLYGTTNSIEDKKAILRSLFLSGDSSRLLNVATHDGNPELRVSAIQSLGLMGSGKGQASALVSVFQGDKDEQIRHAVLNALMIQQNGKALVDLARNEKDPKWKEAIVHKMALVHTPETTNYMLEILK